jgi:hypothetical protein
MPFSFLFKQKYHYVPFPTLAHLTARKYLTHPMLPQARMSNNADESPRRLSLLTHFRESRSPPYVDVATDTAHSQHNTLRYQDDEAQCGFWGEDTSAEYEKEYSASGWDKFFYTLLQVMLVIVIALNLDVIMSKWGMGTMNWRGSTKMQRVNTVQVNSQARIMCELSANT